MLKNGLTKLTKCENINSQEVRRVESCFRIRELRKSMGLTQEELAKRMELKAPSTVAMWETGKRNPPSRILPRLAAELGCVSVEELYQKQSNA